jgi:hypothetical protein
LGWGLLKNSNLMCRKDTKPLPNRFILGFDGLFLNLITSFFIPRLTSVQKKCDERMQSVTIFFYLLNLIERSIKKYNSL